MINLQIS